VSGARSACLALLLVAAAGCRHPGGRAALVESGDERAAEAASAPAGAVADGVWSDARYPWTIHVPSGWEVVPGVDGENPRLTLVDGRTRARLEVSVFPGGALGPRERRGCAWEFTDTAGYRALAVPGPMTVGTCTPEDARYARVLGYYLQHDGVAYDVEEVLPPGKLLDGKAAADACLGGLRLR